MAYSTVTAALTDPFRRMARNFGYGIESKVSNIPIVGAAYHQVRSTFEQTTGTGIYSQALPGMGMQNSSALDPMINAAARNADRCAAKMDDLTRQLEAAGENPPPGLMMKCQLASQALSSWTQLMKSVADEKKNTQQNLSRW